MSEARDFITAARIEVINNNPFFSYLLMRLNLIEDSDMSESTPMGVDGEGKCVYNPDSICEWSREELKGVLIHEALHIALGHTTKLRRGNRDRQIWGMAIDYATNVIVKGQGYQLPGNPLYDTQYDDMAVEEIYQDLYEKANERGGDGRGRRTDSDGDGDGNSGDGESPPQDDDDEDDDEDDDDNSGAGSEDGEEDSDEEETSGPSEEQDDKYDESRGFDSHQETDDDKEAQRWEDVLIAAHEFAKQQGQAPGGRVGDIVGEIFTQDIGWRSMLWKFISNNLITDYSWRRPAKKSRSAGVYLPSVNRKNLDIVVAFDTSGSISDKEFKQFMSEIFYISKAFKEVNMTVLFHTTDVKDVVELDNQSMDEFMDSTTRYTGGTSHMDVFDWISTNKPNAKGIVCFTDGYTTTPEDYRIPTIWVTTGTKDFSFGEVVDVDIQD